DNTNAAITQNQTNGAMLFYNNNSGSADSTVAYRFHVTTGATSAHTILNDGSVGINTSGFVIGGRLNVLFNGNAEQGINIKNSTGSQNGAAIRFIDSGDGFAGGGIYFASSNAVTYSSASDIRLKENIQPATDALAKVSAIEVVDFNFKSDPDKK